MIQNNGANRIRDLIDGDIGNGVCGTGSLTPTASDTGLENEKTDTAYAVTITLTDRQLSVAYILPSVSGNGRTYAEFGIKVNSNATSLNRVVYNSVIKTDNESLIHITRFFINTP